LQQIRLIDNTTVQRHRLNIDKWQTINVNNLALVALLFLYWNHGRYVFVRRGPHGLRQTKTKLLYCHIILLFIPRIRLGYSYIFIEYYVFVVICMHCLLA